MNGTVSSTAGPARSLGRLGRRTDMLFSANDCLDIGTCLGSPVSLDYYDKAPFPFNGTIHRMHVAYVAT
jgi:arylsulfatase